MIKLKELIIETTNDSFYLELVKNNDLNTIEKMVSDAAKRNGYNVGPVYHGSPVANIKIFQTTGNIYARTEGAYFTKTPNTGQWKKWFTMDKKTYSVFLKLKNPANRDILNKLGYKMNGEDTKKWLQNNGYDGVIDDFMEEIVVFDSSNIKSANIITYDDKNEIIPLSKRFDSANDDIRY